MLVFDVRGKGRTTGPDEPDRAWTMADYADDAAGVLDAVGWESCAVLGYSFGGMAAQEPALRYPRRVERLALLSTSSGGAGGASYPFEPLADLALDKRAKRLVELADRRRDAGWQAGHPEAFAALLAETRSLLRPAEAAPERTAAARRQLAARARQHPGPLAKSPGANASRRQSPRRHLVPPRIYGPWSTPSRTLASSSSTAATPSSSRILRQP